jgi:hypothetical protein
VEVLNNFNKMPTIFDRWMLKRPFNAPGLILVIFASNSILAHKLPLDKPLLPKKRHRNRR